MVGDLTVLARSEQLRVKKAFRFGLGRSDVLTEISFYGSRTCSDSATWEVLCSDRPSGTVQLNSSIARDFGALPPLGAVLRAARVTTERALMGDSVP